MQWKAKWAPERPDTTGSYIEDPTQKVPGLDLLRQHQSTGSVPNTVCQGSLFKWGLVSV